MIAGELLWECLVDCPLSRLQYLLSFGDPCFRMNNERFMVPELLFNPSDIGELWLPYKWETNSGSITATFHYVCALFSSFYLLLLKYLQSLILKNWQGYNRWVSRRRSRIQFLCAKSLLSLGSTGNTTNNNTFASTGTAT